MSTPKLCQHESESSAPTDRGTLTMTERCGEVLCDHGVCPSCEKVR